MDQGRRQLQLSRAPEEDSVPAMCSKFEHAKGCRRILSQALIGVLAIAVAGDLAYAQPQSRALTIGEQPGVVPDARDERLPAAFQRQTVFYRTNEPIGTIVVDTVYRYLYLVQENSRAIRYGIGIGEEGFEWQGLLRVVRKVEWPDWTASPDTVRRQPQLPRSMRGGPGNPLGARALVLSEGYRIHGTNQPQTIGSVVLAGCYRLANADIIDLYARASVGTKVVVRQRPTL
jgi:lipoprotein-anchoring transpeptidase ErfK/SrfK